MKKTFFKMASVVMLGASLVIGFPSCENPEVMNTLKEMQEKDSLSSADIAKLQSLLKQAQGELDDLKSQTPSEETSGGSSTPSGVSKSEFGALEGKFDKLDSLFNVFSTTLNQLQTSNNGSIKTLNDNITAINTAVNGLNENVKTLSSNDAKINDYFTKLQETLSKMNQAITDAGGTEIDVPTGPEVEETDTVEVPEIEPVDTTVVVPPSPGEEDGKELKGTPTVGSIIMKDGSLKTADAMIDADKANAIAVVYKVEGGKAYAVGNVHQTKFMWCSSSAKGYSKIDALVTRVSGSAGNLSFSGTYLYGSTGLAELKKVATDYNDGTNYPAWSWCEKYGAINCSGTAFTDGWYFPSVAELFDIWKNKSDVENALEKSGGNKFNSFWYWSSSQYASTANSALKLNFGSGAWSNNTKSFDTTNAVCAVRDFNY